MPVTLQAAIAAGWVALAGCGRLGFGAAPAGDGGVGTERAGDGGGDSCWARWLDHSVQLTEPALLDVPYGYLFEPSLAPDMRTLYFSTPIGGHNTILAMTRTAVGQPWSAPAIVPELQSGADDDRVTISADGLTAIVGTTRAGGGGAGFNLWRATRASTADAFGAFSTAGLEALNDDQDQYGADFGGANLYLSPYTSAENGSTVELALASSASAETATYAADSTVDGLPDDFNLGDPSISPDERVMVFGDAPGTDIAAADVFYATRDAADQPFAFAARVPTINADAAEDDDDELSADGCELYFGSTRGSDFERIWVATVIH